MKFTVKGLEMMGPDEGKVTLEAKPEGATYTSRIFLYVPVAELPLYPFGQELELVLPQAAVAESKAA